MDRPRFQEVEGVREELMAKQNNLGADLTKQILGENPDCGFNTSNGMGSTRRPAFTRHKSTWFAYGSHLWFDIEVTVAKFTDHESI